MILKVLEEKTWGTLEDSGIGNDIFHMTSKVQETKPKRDKWDYIKLKSLCIAKETTNRVKR
jgi:hypothetical protein